MDFFGIIRVKRIPRLPIFAERYPNFKIGPQTYGEPRIIGQGKLASLEIGSFCSISDKVVIFLDGEHRTDWVTTFPFNVLWSECSGFTGHPGTKGGVRIGHDVWLGYGATILSGVSVGTGAVVGANAVVAHDVPPYAIVAGNPARVVRSRFSDDLVERLLASKWWELPREKLLSVMHLLLSNRVKEFLDALQGTTV